MDYRVFNATVSAGLLLILVGTGLAVSWPVAMVVVGAILLAGAFASRAIVRVPPPQEPD